MTATFHTGDCLDVMHQLDADGVRVHLAYLDPPFCTGRDFAFQPPGGGPEEHAYSDRWGCLDTYLDVLRARVAAARQLLTPDGCLVLHVDPQVGHYVKVMLDGIFGRECFANELVWRYRRWPTPTHHFQRMHDTLFRYVRDARHEPRWNQLYEPLAASTVETFGTTRQRADFSSGRRRPGQGEGESPGVAMSDVWEIPIVAPSGAERTGYPTQKPEALLERIVGACSYKGDVVLDPYAGSATSGVVAERMERAWIGIDSSPVAVRVGTARLRDARFGARARAAAGPQLGLGAAPGGTR